MRCLSWSAWTRISPISGSAVMERERLGSPLEVQHAPFHDRARAVAHIERSVERQDVLEARDGPRDGRPEGILGEAPNDQPAECWRQLAQVLDRDPVAPRQRRGYDRIEDLGLV